MNRKRVGREARRDRLKSYTGNQVRLAVVGKRLVLAATAGAATHARAYDLGDNRTYVWRRFRMLNVVDEFTHDRPDIRASSAVACQSGKLDGSLPEQVFDESHERPNLRGH